MIDTRPILVIFHKNCQDGFGAAYAAWCEFGNDAEYLAHQYGDPLPTRDQLDGREVFIVDYSFKKDDLYEVARHANRVTIIDHHKTAKEDLENLSPSDFPNVTVKFDMSHSGAYLAWDYFHPGEPPMLIKYIEDRDLWKWELPSSNTINAYISTVPFDFKEYEQLEVEIEHYLTDVIAKGSALVTYRDQLVERIAKNVDIFLSVINGDDELTFDTSAIPCNGTLRVACVNSPILQSEVANYLLQKYPNVDVAAVFADKADVRTWSLRSRPHQVDVSRICKRFGGGGHEAAAGMTSPVGQPYPRFINIPRTK